MIFDVYFFWFLSFCCLAILFVVGQPLIFRFFNRILRDYPSHLVASGGRIGPLGFGKQTAFLLFVLKEKYRSINDPEMIKSAGRIRTLIMTNLTLTAVFFTLTIYIMFWRQ